MTTLKAEFKAPQKLTAEIKKGGTGGVSEAYVKEQDALTLASAKAYTDAKATEAEQNAKAYTDSVLTNYAAQVDALVGGGIVG